jgi:glycosyltransferase involved in cell wall biosynthesis
MVELSATIICQNEEPNIIKCLNNIYDHVDEIIIIDGGSVDNTVPLIKGYKKEKGINNKISLYMNPFTGHFGDQKNLAISKTSGIWVLNIDADELLEENLLFNLRNLINTDVVEVYGIPRLNFIDGKQTDIYPDYQLRLFRNYCRFVNPVHELLVGWKGETGRKDLSGKGNHILHYKSSSRQKRQLLEYQKIYSFIGYKDSKIQFGIKEFREGLRK